MYNFICACQLYLCTDAPPPEIDCTSGSHLIPDCKGEAQASLFGGTSESAPLASATLALMASCNQKLTRQKLKALLLETADSSYPGIDKKPLLNIVGAVYKACPESDEL